jgi:hypothetical protein
MGSPSTKAPLSGPTGPSGGKSYVSREQVIWDELQRLGKVPSGPLTDEHVEQAKDHRKSTEKQLETSRQLKADEIGRWEQRAARAQAIAELLELENEFQRAPKGWRKWSFERKRDAARRHAGQVFGLPRSLERDDVILEELQAAGRLANSPISELDVEKASLARDQADDYCQEVSKTARDVAGPKADGSSSTDSLIVEKAKRDRDAAAAVHDLAAAQRRLEVAEDHVEEKAARRAREPLLRKALHALNLSALCLSGGGIRSASFSLGILQGLGRCSYDPVKKKVGGILPNLNYLSTVSGGGYIGSWLTRWSTRSDGNPHGNFENSVREMAKGNCPPDTPEPCAIRNLRDYTSYLAPKRGLSGDFLALVATYIRNLVLNWTILLPCVLAVALLPAFNSKLMWWLAERVGEEEWYLLLSGVTAALGMFMVAAALPAGSENGAAIPLLSRVPVGRLASAHTYPFLLSAYLLACWAFVGLSHPKSLYPSVALLAAKAHLAATPASPAREYVDWIKSERVVLSSLTILAMLALGWRRYQALPTWRRVAQYWFAYLLSAIAGVELLDLVFVHVFPWMGPGRSYVIFAVPLVLLAFLLTGTALNGLLSAFESEEDREWMARAGGMLMACIAIWIVMHGLVLSEAPILREASAIVAAVLGPLLSWAGFSPSTASGKTPVNLDQLSKLGRFLAKRKLLLPIGVGFFLLLLVVCASATNQFLLWKMEKWTVMPGFMRGALLLGVYAGVATFASLFVNVNIFSMHGLYRNRLMRAYLGASNGDRRPDPYTNFDPNDNLSMSAAPAQARAPLHILNTTLNLVATRRLAWQERKAEPFTVSALHCGSFRLGYRRTVTYAGEKGPTLATAMAISGAAATPNMGYHSSPLVTLLMTFFNVRLGWWWPNPGPAGSTVFRRSNPKNSLGALLSEAAGITNDTNPWIYVSDGGHFENLGLYEVVMRRCHTVVVVDGSADGQFTMEDLGNAFRKIQIDFGIPIELRQGGHIHTGMNEGNCHAAVYAIRYECVDGSGVPDGVLVYIKASLCSKLSEDVKHYACSHPSFPHEPTFDQFFGESQFESYRRLGVHVVEHILRPIVPGWFPPEEVSLDRFVELARAHASGSAPAAVPSLLQRYRRAWERMSQGKSAG